MKPIEDPVIRRDGKSMIDFAKLMGAKAASHAKPSEKKRYCMLCDDGSYFESLITPLEKTTRPGS